MRIIARYIKLGFRIMQELVTPKRAVEELVGETTVKKAKQQTRARGLQELDVGITQYLSSDEFKGIQGTIKQRYADFLVNEIDKNDKIIHLVDEGVKLGKSRKEKKMEKRRSEREVFQDKSPEEISEMKSKMKEESKPKYELSEENKTKILELMTPEELAEIEALFSSGDNMETKSKYDDKQTRGNLHKLLREAFQGKLESVTSPENTIRIALAKNNAGNRRRNPQESINHVDENGVVNYGLGPFKNYLHFTVYKENRETMEVASTIAKYLRITNKSISYAGTKDRRGVTCQRFSIYKGKVARVSSLNKGLKNTTLGGFAYEDNPIGLGDLNGNVFTIVIRNVKAVDENANLEELVGQSFNVLKNQGFINYFGMQRFGTFSISTHVLGAYLLREDWKGAAELVLAEQDIVLPDSVQARRIWAETKNAALALRKMPRRCSAECAILSVLEKEKLVDDEDFSSQSYFKSIMAIPKNLRSMYVHAYQSYVWNLVVSKRIELFGTTVQEGDLVIVNKSDKEAKSETDAASTADDFPEDVSSDNFVRARPLTKEDIESGKYSIFDIVLPTPGFDILYPQNDKLLTVYQEVMAKDNLDPKSMNRKVRDFSLAGSYRRIMGRPDDLSYNIVKYSDPLAPLVRTDLQILRRNSDKIAEDPNFDFESDRVISNDEPEANKVAVVLKMKLGVSSYATMALREFMKADTSRFGELVNVQDD